jgi:isocitrate/isopropylmalate dehydrogenase
MERKRVVVIEGEDASPEAVRPTLALIEKLNLDIEWLHPAVGDAGIERHGSVFPDEARQAIDEADATFFGATSGQSMAALRYLRWGKGTYANVRPARWMPGYKSPLARPEGIDLVIVRENLEDMYLMIEGELENLRPANLVSPITQRAAADMGPGQFAVKVITEAGTEQVTRFAFELAQRRKAGGLPGKVTCTSKYNMLPKSDGLFLEVAQRVASSYPDIAFETFIVDDFAHRLVTQPHKLDVVVMPNLYGDILSDAAGGIIGGLGLAPSGCYGNEYAYFESVHGTAPDIAGQNRINPTATIQSAVMMLEYLGFEEEAMRINTALERVYAAGRTLTPDQGGNASTTEFAAAVADHM